MNFTHELNENEIIERVRALQARARNVNDASWVEIKFWPHDWTCYGGMLDLRTHGETAQRVLEAFDRALTALENRDRNLSQTIGAPIPEHT